MGRMAKLKEIEENRRKEIEKIFVNGKMVNRVNFNLVAENYKEGKHEKWFKRNLLCIYADGTIIRNIKNTVGAYCFAGISNGSVVFTDFETCEDLNIVSLDTVGFEELAILKAFYAAKEAGFTQIVFFHDCITIQQDAEKRKYKNGHEFPLQWEFYDAIHSFEGNICFQKITSKDNPYHNLVDKTLRATKTYLEYASSGRGKGKKESMLNNLKTELEKLLQKTALD